MVDLPIARQFVLLVRRLEALPRRRFAVVTGIGMFALWMAVHLTLERSLQAAVLSGAIVSLFFGGSQYLLWPYR